MATISLGGGRSSAAAAAASNGTASRQAKSFNFIVIPSSDMIALHKRRRTGQAAEPARLDVKSLAARRRTGGSDMEATEAADIISELNEEKVEAEQEARFRNRAALQIAIIAAVLAI